MDDGIDIIFSPCF